MVEQVGICEKHELPLDRDGECELCRLSDMPSKAPPQRSAWWAVVIPLLILLAGAAWTFASLGPEPQEAPAQGVIAPRPPSEEPEAEPEAEPEPEPEAPEPAPAEAAPAPAAPRPPTPPPAPEDIPRPDDFAE